MEHFTESQLRTQLKALLYFFAKKSEQPGRELQEILREVISELYDDVSTAQKEQRTLRLVQSH